MKGKWHIAACAALAAVLTASFHLYYVFLPFLVWLYWFYCLRRVSKYQLLLVILCFCGLFFLLTQKAQTNQINDQAVENLLSLEGKIITPVKTSDNHFEFTLLDSQLHEKIRVVYFKQHDGELWQSLPFNGAFCVIDGSLIRPAEAKNPGQFDYRSYLKQQEINHQLVLADLTHLSCSGRSFFSFLDTWRNAVIGRTATLSPFTSSWLNALVWGEDTNISTETKVLFQRWNLSHLLAISGLHVGLLVSLVYILLVKTTLLTKEKAQWFVMFFLPVYAVMAGGEPSVWRASSMTFLLLLCIKFQKQISITDSFSLLFLGFIFWEHTQLNHLGFQFSYLVTFVLLLSKKLFTESTSKVFLLLKISLLSQLAILPLQLNNFYFFNPLAVLLNLIVVPYFTAFVIPLLFLLAMLLPLFPSLVKIADRAFAAVHSSFLHLISMIDHSFYYPWVIGEFPLVMIFPYFFIFILFMGRLERKKLTEAFAFGCLLVVLLVSISLRPYINPEGSVTMLDVGQGDSFVIELPYRRGVILVDAAAAVMNFKTPTDKTFNEVIKPFLYSKGISKIDALILSHEDFDHAGSVPYLLGEFKVDNIFLHPFSSLPNAWSEHRNSSRIHRVRKGDIVTINDQLFYVLSPDLDSEEPNRNSLVLFTKLGGLRWLFTGDITKSEEMALMKHFPRLKIDVLKVAHHGSKTSSSDAFLTAVHPRWAWISAGENNRYGHPAEEVINRLKEQDVVIFRTDESNAVQYLFSDGKGTFSAFQP